MTAADTSRSAGGDRPLLGLRRRPGRLARAVFRLPLKAYQHDAGPAVGRTFVAFTHVGRKTGQLHQTVAMVLRYDRVTGEAVVCAAWGPQTDWYRNLQVRPVVQVQLGGQTFTPQQRFLPDGEALDVAVEFRRQHPHRLRFFSTVLGWGDLRDDAAVRQFVRSHPFVAFRPAEEPVPSAPGSGGRGETREDVTKAAPTKADDIRQLAISAAVCSGLTAFTLWRPFAGRRVLGIFFALTGLLWNGLLAAKAPEQYPMLARRAPWGWYRRAGLAVTEPAPRVRRGHDRGRDGTRRPRPQSPPGCPTRPAGRGRLPAGRHPAGHLHAGQPDPRRRSPAPGPPSVADGGLPPAVEGIASVRARADLAG